MPASQTIPAIRITHATLPSIDFTVADPELIGLTEDELADVADYAREGADLWLTAHGRPPGIKAAVAQ
jgi:hypothetical protein